VSHRCQNILCVLKILHGERQVVQRAEFDAVAHGGLGSLCFRASSLEASGSNGIDRWIELLDALDERFQHLERGEVAARNLVAQLDCG
jgi:hypothetical protein